MCRFLGFPCLHCRPGLARPRSIGVMSFFLNFTFVSGISLFAASEIFRKGVKNAVNMGRNARFGLAL